MENETILNEPEATTWNVAIPLEFKPLLQEVATKFGYKNQANAVRNSMLAGCQLALTNPLKFLDLLIKANEPNKLL